MEIRRILGLPVSRRVIITLIIVLPIVGLFIGYIGAYGGGGSTITVSPAVTPRAIGLSAGQSRTFSVIVRNPEDQGVRVTSISAGSSEAAEGSCPAGALTSAELTDPRGFIRAGGVNAYAVTVSLAASADERCLDQAITLPLTVKLQSN